MSGDWGGGYAQRLARNVLYAGVELKLEGTDELEEEGLHPAAAAALASARRITKTKTKAKTTDRELTHSTRAKRYPMQDRAPPRKLRTLPHTPGTTLPPGMSLNHRSGLWVDVVVRKTERWAVAQRRSVVCSLELVRVLAPYLRRGVDKRDGKDDRLAR